MSCNTYSNTCLVRYIASTRITDASGSLWMTVFDPFASKVVGISAQELKQSKQYDEKTFYKIIQEASYK